MVWKDDSITVCLIVDTEFYLVESESCTVMYLVFTSYFY